MKQTDESAGGAGVTYQPLDLVSASSRIGLFDFWVLSGTGFAALFGIYLLIVGLCADPAAVWISVVYFAVSAVYAAVTASIAATVPRAVSLPVLPILEKWRAGSLTIREVVYPVLLAFAVGTVVSYLAFTYEQVSITWIGRSASATAITTHHLRIGPLELICSAILEEILFRTICFAAFVAIIRWTWQTPIIHPWIPIWTANILQALFFGGAHIAVGRGIFAAEPWYIRLPLVSQTWTGLALGCVYWSFGTESAIVCHTAFDLSILAMMRRLIRLPIP